MEDLNWVSSVLVIPYTEQAILSFSDNKSSVVWSASPTKSVQAPILQVLDTRNLELRNEKYDNSENHLWQRFDYPRDTLLPGSEKYYRTGPWNGLGYSGAPELKPNPLFNFEFVSNKDEVYYNFYLKNEFAKSRVVVDQTNGYTRSCYGCNSGTQSWEVFMLEPRDNCDRHVVCCVDIKCGGANGEGKVKIALEVLAVIFVICGMLLLAHYIHNFRVKKGLEDNLGTYSRIKNQNNEGQTENLELLFFDLDKISEATSNISSNNKIEKGNFGPAYKVMLQQAERTTESNNNLSYYAS
ncbi:hypothetical protein FEM48_Zijuj01G0214800 [Ziziphus jujuba var. spinosa]|uniref:Bulb-type lectin domain-containing protein n=1 Tax=Ziziphus jujuba var. spinosa TaxID=714518 RepID=A0A978W3N6_ZIZJJ|nr:hypothetical protein FEM48_Zijuj01G0214800 [Ziziphus jujuba var. spinosa]